jgi:hypothetical protein
MKIGPGGLAPGPFFVGLFLITLVLPLGKTAEPVGMGKIDTAIAVFLQSIQ